MIVSELEILRVLGLLARGRDDAGARSARSATGDIPCASARPDPVGATTGSDVPPAREERLGELRSRLHRGQYEVAPADVADKMVGRALCDQVARLLDSRTDRLTGR